MFQFLFRRIFGAGMTVVHRRGYHDTANPMEGEMIIIAAAKRFTQIRF